MNELVVIVEFEVRPERRAEFDERIAVNAKASVAKEPGCRQLDVLRAIDDPNRVVLYEVYDSEDEFKSHLEQAHTKTFLAAAKELVDKQTVVKLSRTVAPAKR